MNRAARRAENSARGRPFPRLGSIGPSRLAKPATVRFRAPDRIAALQAQVPHWRELQTVADREGVSPSDYADVLALYVEIVELVRSIWRSFDDPVRNYATKIRKAFVAGRRGLDRAGLASWLDGRDMTLTVELGVAGPDDTRDISSDDLAAGSHGPLDEFQPVHFEDALRLADELTAEHGANRFNVILCREPV